MNLITEGNMSPKSDSVPNVPTKHIHNFKRETYIQEDIYINIYDVSILQRKTNFQPIK
jgi:hypothetical protein